MLTGVTRKRGSAGEVLNINNSLSSDGAQAIRRGAWAPCVHMWHGEEGGGGGGGGGGGERVTGGQTEREQRCLLK